MDRQIAKLINLMLLYLCFAEIVSISNGTSMIVVPSVVATPIPAPSATVGVGFSEMMIQPSATLTSANSMDLLPSSVAIRQLTSITPNGLEMSTTATLTSKDSSSLLSSMVTATPIPMVNDEVTTGVPSTDHPETNAKTTDGIVPETTRGTKETGGSEATTLIPISTEILALIAIGLSGASCCCLIAFSLGCALALTYRGCTNYKRNRAKKEMEDSVFRSATLQRPLGNAISENFPVSIENPAFKDMSPDVEMADMPSTLNRKDSSTNGYSW